MFRTTNPFKLIISVPILFIILTASFITWIHIKQADDKFSNDYENLTAALIEEEKLRVDTILDSITSYIIFNKASSTNILKDRIKSRVLIADKMLQNIYNKSVGILSQSTIQINLLSSLSQVNAEQKGKYFIYGVSDKKSKNKANDLELVTQINNLLKMKNEGFIFYEQINKENQVNKFIGYIKKFESSDFVIGYKESLDTFQEKIKDDVLNRLDLMKIEGSIYTLNDKLEIIQHSNNKKLVSKHIKEYEKDKNILYLQKEYLTFSKRDLIYNEKNKYYWKKINDNTYKIVSFSYVKDWDWLIAVDVNIHNVKENITNIIGIKQVQRDETIIDSIKTAFIFIIIASIISYFVSDYINGVLKSYKKNIERQKLVLKHLNSSLEDKVEEKTKQLQILNTKLNEKFKVEVKKNREKDQLLFDQSKQAIMGEMIGNIAHQWRQPLSTITTVASGNTIKIDYDVFEKEELKKDFDLIVDTAQYLSETIDDFRNFFIENKNVERFDLVDIIQRDLNLVSSTFTKNYINIIKNFNSIEVKSIKNELIQAILNILNNAKDALLLKEQNSRHIVIDLYEDKNSAIIEIKDSGGGINDEIIDRIFEQYFTTKGKDTGTGLGLYMTKQIIEESLKGTLCVSNQEFVCEEQLYYGACFKITLPLKI